MSDRILVSTRKGLFIVARGASGWTIDRTAFLGDNVSLAIEDPRDGAIHAALDHGHFGCKMHRSRDGGTTWEECATPVFPDKPEDPEDPEDKNPWKLMSVWAMSAGGADEPGVMWLGTIPGGLFRSNDSGDSWMLVRPLWDHPDRKKWFGGGSEQPGLHSILVHPENSRHVMVGVSCGGTWVTENGGETWDCRADGMWAAYMPPEQKNNPVIQDPHLIVQCPSAPEVYWTQHHNGIFRTRDGGRNWDDITAAEPSVFGFAVAVHPNDPETAWFVPAIKDEKRIPVDGNVVVSRTRDGGKTFEVLREGLPQGHSYDLTFRHGLDIDASGERLAFGSTTGALWVTENGGDSWQTVSRHLPQVYSVRFMA